MVTYPRRLVLVRRYAKPLWWAHTLTLLVFLPLIPHTKHLHLVLSPVTVFLSRGELQQDSAAGRATRISASTPART